MPISAARTITDSTGKAAGKVEGVLKANNRGADKGAHFSDSKITYDSIGDDFDAFTVSAVISMTEEDMAALNGGKGVIAARFLSTENDTNSYQMSIDFVHRRTKHILLCEVVERA